MPTMNPWEANALRYNFREDAETPTSSAAGTATTAAIAVAPKDYVHDSVIYPGLYTQSGFDMMDILTRVVTRPNPVVQLGAVDASCALLVCDLAQPDRPVVYASEAFEQLTGYAQHEILGRNCRVLQAPGPGSVSKPSTKSTKSKPGGRTGTGTGDSKKDESRKAATVMDKKVVREMRRAVEANAEVEVEVLNFTRDGRPFVNCLAIIPVCWDSGSVPRYSVGFQAEKTW
ncbi:hypothetical protein DL764_010396 [Monosporascus ibericus]|uniref:PAS domain-containing protein n=1 Tax=Monosporascus ibericus TaxID=155417 RepID=A0A4Q4SSU2_9PEZI|nr:hypothetical protein DL764_010396 [Monosporascus ibericus]